MLLKENNLAKVDLAGTKLNNFDLCQLSNAIKENNSLRELCLGGIVIGCDIKDDGIKYLAATLEENSQLNYLNLRANSITDKGIETLLSSLRKNTLLRFLDLRSNPITDCGKKILSEQALNKNIEIMFDE